MTLLKQILKGLLFFFWVLQASLVFGQSHSDLLQQFSEIKEEYRLNKIDESRAILDNLQPVLCSEGLPEPCIHSTLIKAEIYRSLGEKKRFKELVSFGLQKISEHNLEHHSLHPKFYIELSFFEAGEANMNANIEYEEVADSLIREHNIEGITKASILILKGSNTGARGDFKTAIELYNRALSIVSTMDRSIEVISMLSHIYNNMGVSYRRLGDIESAMNHYQLNLNLVKENFGENHRELFYVYNSLGSIYYTLGDFGTAADHFLRATGIVEKNRGRLEDNYAAALNNAAGSYYRMNDIDRSLELLEEAQRIKEQTLGPEHPRTAVGYTNLSVLYMQNGNFEAALKNARLSIEVRRNIFGEVHPDLVFAIKQYGNILVEIGDHEKGRDQYREAASIVRMALGPNHPDLWDILIKTGKSFISQNRPEEAKSQFSRSINMMVGNFSAQTSADEDLEKVSHPFFYLEALKALAETELQIFDETGSFDSLIHSFELFEKASGTIDHLQFRYKSEASKLNLIHNNYTVYSNSIKAAYYLLEQTNDPQWLDEIIQFSERSRSRMALELIQEAEAKQFAGVPENILARETELNQTIAHHYQQLALEQDKGDNADPKRLEQQRDSLFTLKQQLEDYTQLLEEQFPVYHQLKFSRNLVGKEQAQEMLSDDQTILKYIVGDDFLMAVTISPTESNVEYFETSANIKASVELLRESTLNGDSETLRKQSRLLYSTLFEPVTKHISTKSVIIIPDESLYYLPFEMLLTEEPGKDDDYNQFPFLLHKYNISYAPSVTVLDYMNRERNSSPRNLLALAPFNQSIDERSTELYTERTMSTLTPLTLTEFETREIAGLFREKDSIYDYIFPETADILLHKEASKENFLNRELEQYGFLHFATHAFINESNPDLSGIALWGKEESGILYVNDIYNMRFDADLAVLGACDTGLGTLYRGEGLIGFTRAFIYAGVSNLAVSMWRVNDQPTSRLMISFYKKIREGYGYSEALRAAKLELIEYPEFSEPKNWAAFVLYGF